MSKEGEGSPVAKKAAVKKKVVPAVEQEVQVLEPVGFRLPNKIATIKFIPKRKGMAASVEDNHVISGGMLTNSVKRYFCPLQRSGGIANILSKEEKTYLEETLGINLSVYGDFWASFSVMLRKDSASNKFDMSDPIGYISVKILEAYKDDIAPNWKARNDKMTYQFAITFPGEEVNENKLRLDVKKLAFKLFGKIEDDKEKLLGVLKLITNQPVSATSTMDWLQGTVQEHVDSNPANFVSILKDASFETRILIKRGIEVGVIKKKGNKHETIDGLDLCNPGQTSTFENTVKFLEQDKNQEVRLLLEARIDNAK